MSDYLTIGEAARAVRLSERTIRRALRDPVRPLRHYRPGRRVIITRADLTRWLEAHVAVLTAQPAVLDRISPAARALLDGLIGTPATPAAEKAAPLQARPPDYLSAGDRHA